MRIRVVEAAAAELGLQLESFKAGFWSASGLWTLVVRFHSFAGFMWTFSSCGFGDLGVLRATCC